MSRSLGEFLRVAGRRLTGRAAPGSSVMTEWDWYARDYLKGRIPRGEYLGDDWNDPATIGADVPAGEVVQHLIDRVILPFLGTPSTLLEIGCGAGRFTVPLSARVPKIIAADTSPAMLQLLRSRLSPEAKVTPHLLDGRGLGGIPDHSIAAALTYDVFVHLSHQDIYGYLRELRRVLVPGGRAVIHHSNLLSDLGWRKFENDCDRHLRGLPPKGQFVVMTPELLRELATRAGLVADEMVTQVVRRDCIALLRSP